MQAAFEFYKPKIDTQKVLFNRKIIPQMFLLHPKNLIPDTQKRPHFFTQQ